MKKLIITCVLLFSGTLYLNAFQKNFRQATLIQKDGKEVSVLLNFQNWKNNPQSVKYKLSENGESITASPQDIGGFSVVGEAKYIAAEVSIDVSSDLNEQLVTYKEPNWERQHLFLKVLVDSDVDLLYYASSRYKRFYYQKQGESTPTQLIYKRYAVDNRSVKHNRAYRKQLYDEVNCGLGQADFKKLEYRMKDLLKYFQNYNQCEGGEVVTASNTDSKMETFWHLKAGFNLFSATVEDITRQSFGPTLVSESKTTGNFGPRLGVEFELIPSTNNKAWGFYIESAFEFMTIEETLFNVPAFLRINGVVQNALVTQDYKLSINRLTFGAGARRFFHLDPETSLFLSAGILSNFAIQFDSKIAFSNYREAPEIGATTVDAEGEHNLVFGLGFKKSKFSGELRYNLNRQVLVGQTIRSAEVGGITFLLGMTL